MNDNVQILIKVPASWVADTLGMGEYREHRDAILGYSLKCKNLDEVQELIERHKKHWCSGECIYFIRKDGTDMECSRGPVEDELDENETSRLMKIFENACC